MSARLRLFVALELPAQVRAALARWAAFAAPPTVRLVAEQDLHVTLAFLGARSPADADAVAALLPAVAGAQPLDALETAGALWLPRRSPAVLTVALGEQRALATLRARLVEALAAAIGFEPERRPFRPHVTVARVPGGARVRAAEPPAPAPALTFAGEALTLVRSRTDPGGARYEPLARTALDSRSPGGPGQRTS